MQVQLSCRPKGSARVTSTGKNTRLGQIARTTQEIRPPKTALHLAVKDLAGKLVYVAIFALAYTLRSERKTLFSGQVFANRIINLWATGAIIFMIAGIYNPLLNSAFQLAYIAPQVLLLIGVVVTGIILTLELRKIST